MLFTHDTEAALASVAALVNTLPGSVPGDTDPDTLTTVAELDRFLAAHGWSGRREGTPAELEQVRSLRPRLAGLWSLDEEQAVAAVNAMLVENGALPQLVRHDGWDWHLHATPDDAPLARRMAVEAAMAMVDVIRAGQLGPPAHLRVDDLRQRAGRPVQEPVPALLRRRLREPGQRRGLPGPESPLSDGSRHGGKPASGA